MLNVKIEIFIVVKNDLFIFNFFFYITKIFAIYFTILQQHHLHLNILVNKILRDRDVAIHEHHFHFHIHLRYTHNPVARNYLSLN